MRRRLLNILATFSLLVCLAGVVAWGRSYEVCDEVHVIRGLRSASVMSLGGSYTLSMHPYPRPFGDGWTWDAYGKRSHAAAVVRRLWLFEWDHGGGPRRTATLDVVVPHWVVPAVFGPLPAVQIARWRRGRRLARRQGFDVDPARPAA